jgi:hypothetical protein
MSPSADNGDAPRSAGSAALKGAVLIALAVIVGIFLLQAVDDDTPSTAKATADTSKPAATTTTTVRPANTTTTVKPAEPKPPAELAVIVLNGGAATGKAAEMRTQLVNVGYTNQPEANNWEGHTQTGNTVQCKPERQRDAVALSQQSPLQGSTVVAYPSPVPTPVPANNDCIVVVGAAG